MYWNLTYQPRGQKGCHFADDIFKSSFMNEKFCLSIQILLEFAPNRSIDKPLPEPMLTQFTDTYMQHLGEMS